MTPPTTPAPVTRSPGKVRIEGVEPLAGWGRGEENTFVGSLRVALAALGQRATYAELMGVSGAAFRLHVARPEWCASAPDATVGFDCSRPALAAFGYDPETLSTLDSDAEPADYWQTLQAVLRSIEGGSPVLGINLEGGMDWGVIAGYEETAFLCRTYEHPSGDYAVATHWPCIVEILHRRGLPHEARQRFVDSLDLAVRLAHAKRFGQYASGFAAYEAWIGDLENEPRFERLDPEARRECMHANAWVYHSLCDARAAAARHLTAGRQALREETAAESGRAGTATALRTAAAAGRSGEPGVAGALAARLESVEAAADTYGRLALMLSEARELAPFPNQREPDAWSRRTRLAQAGLLKRALAMEKQAIAALEAALRAAAD